MTPSPPPYITPDAMLAVLDRATIAAEEEARRMKIENAPKLAKQAAMAAAREEARQRKLAERLANATARRQARLQTGKARNGFPNTESMADGRRGSSSKTKPGKKLPTSVPIASATSAGPSNNSKASATNLAATELRLADEARCLDGTRAEDLFAAEPAKRRQMAKALALEHAVASPRPIFFRTFLANGFLDQVRFLWHVLLEAELQGAIPVLPEAVLKPAPLLPRSNRSSPDSSAAGLVGSLDTVWDLDSYLLHLHCFTGVVAVRPKDVGISVSMGVPSKDARIDSNGLRKLVRSERILVQRAAPTSGAEHGMRQLLSTRLTSATAAVIGNSSMDAELFQLAASSQAHQPQLVASMLRALTKSTSSVLRPHKAVASEWLDRLWRTHRRALLPTELVLTRASLALTRLRNVVKGMRDVDDAKKHSDEPSHELFSAHLMHDEKSLVAAAAAKASLRQALPTSMSGSAGAAANDASDVASFPVPLDAEVDHTGAAPSPMHIVERIQLISEGRARRRRKRLDSEARRQVLFVSPAELPAMPLIIAAAWAVELPAFSLPMLLQNQAPLDRWQKALAASLADKSTTRSGPSLPDTGTGSDSGVDRWINRAVELIVQVTSERFYGPSSSATFHDVALMRCEARLAITSRGLAWSLLDASPTPAILRRLFQLSLVEAYEHQQQHKGKEEVGPSFEAALSESYSYTTGAALRCPASATELAGIISTRDEIVSPHRASSRQSRSDQ